MKKKLLYLNFHPAFHPPKSGGELRYWHLATRLAEEYSVRMLNPTFGEATREEILHAPDCVEERFPKARVYNGWHHFFDRWGRFTECSGLVAMLAAKHDAAYSKAVREHAAQADLVIHASPFVFPVYPRKRRGQVMIYDSYNVESLLAREVFRKGRWPISRWASGTVEKHERALCREADLIFTCSEEDSALFQRLYGVCPGKLAVIPNGVETGTLTLPTATQRKEARQRFQLGTEKLAALFFGSFHPPNVEAGEFICRVLAPALPHMQFLIAGKVCEALGGLVNQQGVANVRLLGLVSEEDKQKLLHGCDFALNPMFSGSGTNLKMLEYMAVGLPIITTPLGARGLAMENDRHGAVVEAPMFRQALRDLSNDPSKRHLYARNSRALVEKQFDWDGIADKYLNMLRIRTQKRVMMLNDYPIAPVAAGGQIRLYAVGSSIASAGVPVTALTYTDHPVGRHVLHTPDFEEIQFPRGSVQRSLDRFWSQVAGSSADDTSMALSLKYLPIRFLSGLPEWMPKGRLSRLPRYAFRNTSQIAYLLFSHSYMLPLAARFPNTPWHYESHNVEYLLKEKLYGNGRLGRWMVGEVRKLEESAGKGGRSVTCVSAEDARIFQERFGWSEAQLRVAANGVEGDAVVPLTPAEKAKRRRAYGLGGEPLFVFLGSGHPPNAEAARFILNELCWHFSHATFLIIGSVNGWFHSQAIPEQVVFLGMVDSPVKDALLQVADLALNPLMMGSGSSLKVPEYLRAGLPVVSTP
ncbi:MAG: glycosyltransferase, partial [Candidatus Sumerlaeia bacterium]|nr:glycosyltransferase [Candidatus Sumerlaeia bacterium]